MWKQNTKYVLDAALYSEFCLKEEGICHKLGFLEFTVDVVDRDGAVVLITVDGKKMKPCDFISKGAILVDCIFVKSESKYFLEV
ncbi:glucoamylase (glucan-1,4-alpha-glucosidase), GH15 family [Pectobacterium phage POP12]|nr:glucoamylase (glucan-1,4-alpha-glucosidase), GH15 family [Pectobacterium phage POP12]